MSALNSDDHDFLKLLRYDLQALANVAEGGESGEEDEGNEDEDQEYDCEGGEDEEQDDLNIDPIRLYDTLLQKGRFPTSIISKVDLMQQQATNAVLDQEFWDWVAQSQEKVKCRTKIEKEDDVEEIDDDMTGPSSSSSIKRRGVKSDNMPQYLSVTREKEDLELKCVKVQETLKKLGEKVTKQDEHESADDEQVYTTLMKSLGADFGNPLQPESKYKFCPWCSNMLQIRRWNAQSKDNWRWKCMTCPYSLPIPVQQRFVTFFQRDSDDEEQIIDTTKANEHRQKTEILCPKCNFREAYFYQMQTRSADEPMTTFYECCNRACGNHWRD